MTDPRLTDYEPDYSWMDAYSRPSDDLALSGKAIVAAVCAGLALGILLAVVVA